MGPHVSIDVLGLQPGATQTEAFQLPKPEKQFSMFPTCRVSVRMTGIGSPVWRLFTDGRYNANPTALSWWAGELPPFRLTILWPRLVVITQRSSLVLLKPSDGPICSSLVVSKCVFSTIPSTLRGLPLVSLMLGETLRWPTHVMTLICGPKEVLTSLFTMYLVMLGTPGTSVDIAATFGLKWVHFRV